MPDAARAAREAKLLERWESAERAAAAAERFAIHAEVGAAAAERVAVTAEKRAESALRTLRDAHDLYHDFVAGQRRDPMAEPGPT